MTRSVTDSIAAPRWCHHETVRDPGELLSGSVALVTGGAHALGRSTVEGLARHGARVHVVDLAAEALELLSIEMASAELDVVTHCCDLLDAPALVTLVSSIGALDIVINHVGHQPHDVGDFTGTDESIWHDVFDVTFWPAIEVCHAVLPTMIAAGHGSIVNLTVTDESELSGGHPLRAAARAALAEFSRGLALEVAAHGISVDVVLRDLTTTPHLPYEAPLGDDDITDVILQLVSDLQRFAAP